MSILIASLHEDRLNLNGDSANAQVLAQYLRWLDFDVSLVSLDNLAGLELLPDFLVVGHGSRAAWASLDGQVPEIMNYVSSFVTSGGVGMAIASGSHLFFGEGAHHLVNRPLGQVERVSKFVCLDIESENLRGLRDAGLSEHLVGYKNTDTDADDFRLVSNFALTNLHGPLLAKNPELVLFLINKILSKKQMPQLTWRDFAGNVQIAKDLDLISGVRRLEIKLAAD
jgi:CobQ-like glutamine amidotransferase family enzyme